MSATSILTGTTMGFDILGGIFAQNAADSQAQSMRDQISLVRAESEADIARYAEQTKDFKAQQSLKYMKSGVLLEGSPLDILDETVRISSENISAMRAKTAAEISGIRSKASAVEGQGRAAFIAGLGGAAKTAINQSGRLAAGAEPKRTAGSSSYTPGTPTRQSLTNLGFGTKGKGLNLGFGY